MKLRNKKTKEIVHARFCGITFTDDDDHLLKVWLRDENCEYEYNSLKELNEEWEDYEEPKEYWYYDTTKNGVEKITHLEDKEKDQEIGNYFDTREEAKKAVEKLKAWKRLKDKGFRFERYGMGGEYGNTITFSDYVEYNEETRADLDLLFGGEE
jgi:hypothetical protein